MTIIDENEIEAEIPGKCEHSELAKAITEARRLAQQFLAHGTRNGEDRGVTLRDETGHLMARVRLADERLNG